VLKLQSSKNDFSAPSLLERAGGEDFFGAQNLSFSGPFLPLSFQSFFLLEKNKKKGFSLLSGLKYKFSFS
jgi:hypothetical protein